MHDRAFGTTGVRLSALGFGVVPLSVTKDRPSESDAVRTIHEALDCGVSWLDTADAYCQDASEVGYGERLVARALRERSGNPGEVRVATKGGHVRPDGKWAVDGHPEHLRAACEASLRALGMDSIFLYQLHRPDPSVYFPDSVGALADLKREGKIQHVGLSNVEVAHLRTARRIVPIASVQNRANLVDRDYFTTGVVDACERLGIAFIAHSPLGGVFGHERLGAHPTLRGLGERRGVTPYQIAVSWLLTVSPCIFPIPGARRVAHVREAVAAAALTLDPEEMAALDGSFPACGRLEKAYLTARRELGYLRRNSRALLRKTAWKREAVRR